MTDIAVSHADPQQARGSLRSRLARAASLLQILAVGAFCLWLSPLDTRTVFAGTTEYIRTSGFGPYERLVFPHIHRRPFEACAGIEAAHEASLKRIEQALPGIEASSSYELVRVFRLIGAFNRESQTFYSSACPGEWSYYYTYVDYQSSLMKVTPALWVIDALHRSEIYIVVFMIVGSWFGIFAFFWLTKRLANSALVGFISLAVLWFSVSAFGPILYADFKLNLFNSFGLVALATFLCDRSATGPRLRSWGIDALAAFAFGVFALLLTFPRLPSTKLDATVVIACVFAVAAIRRDLVVFRRALLLVVFVTAVQWPYERYSKTLLGPVSPVNTAAADEFKLVNAVQFLNERPSHFGNFILDFNFTWMFDADYYLRRLSQVYEFHHGYPYWGRQFLKETVVHHAPELLNAWWKRFVIQVAYHKELVYGIYGNRPNLGTAVLWLGVALAFLVLFRGRRLSSVWPLAGLVFWEVFGLHTFLALMHVHNVYLLKGIPLLWCALPCVTVVLLRDGVACARQGWHRPIFDRLPRGRRLAILAISVAGAGLVVGVWVVREVRKEIHVTRIWRAVHAGQYHRDAYLSVDELAMEVEAIRKLGGDAPGTVSMYGAWAMFGYRERLGNYNRLTGNPVPVAQVAAVQIPLYRRALSEGPDNPHLYSYARYFEDPDWADVFRRGLDRFPDHPWASMMSWFLATEAPNFDAEERAHYYRLYEESVRKRLRESARFRPGLRPTPAVTAPGPTHAVEAGTLVTLLPGEIAKVEPFNTVGSDRLAVGAFVKVMEGAVTVQLGGHPRAKLAESPLLTPADPVAYRAWHFAGLDASPLVKENSAWLEFQAGPQGARFVLRELYPLPENPRWFR